MLSKAEDAILNVGTGTMVAVIGGALSRVLYDNGHVKSAMALGVASIAVSAANFWQFSEKVDSLRVDAVKKGTADFS